MTDRAGIMAKLPPSGVPAGTLERKWESFSSKMPQLSPDRKRQCEIIVIGGGLAACAASVALAEQGYSVRMISSMESPLHESTTYMRGGINAARNYANDGDSCDRFFRDTMEYGAWQSREADTYRMAQLSGKVLDICAALCVPFIREPGGLLKPNRNPGGMTARSFQARGQTGRQLLQAFYSAFLRHTANGNAKLVGRREITDICVYDGHACGVVTRNILNGNEETYSADVIVLACGGYSGIYNALPNIFYGGINPLWAAYRAGAAFANPCFSLELPATANRWRTVPEDYISSQRCPGGLWVNYSLETTIPGLFAIGEANFSVHGANCMPGNAPLQELTDAIFIAPPAIGAYLARTGKKQSGVDTQQLFGNAVSSSERHKERIFAINGKTPPQHFHTRLAEIMRDKVGFIRYSYRLQQALREIRSLRQDFYSDLLLPRPSYYNIPYEIAFRTANSLDLAELIVKDAILRKETCGAHFRMEYSSDGEKKEEKHYIRAWIRNGGKADIPFREKLVFSDKDDNEPVHTIRKQNRSKTRKNSRKNIRPGR